MELFLGMFSGEWERRRAAILHDRERLSGGQDGNEDEWLKTGTGGGQGAGYSSMFGTNSSAADGNRSYSGLKYRPSGHGVPRPMAIRLTQVAQGSQPAVVKLASYGAGSRAGAMLDYVSREGQIAVENERGEKIHNRDGLKSVPGGWEHLLSNRAESRDIASFRFEISGHHQDLKEDAAFDLSANALRAGLGDRRFAFAIVQESDDALVIRGLVVLRSPSSGERLTADGKAEEIVKDRLDQALAKGQINSPASMSFEGYGNGVEYGTARLRALVAENEGSVVRDEAGSTIADATEAGALVQQTWRHEMESRKVRDVMHLIMSAREGTDVNAFQNATRAFLASEFAENGYRYVFAVHDPKDDPKGEHDGGKRPHVHAHAIVTMRSDFGDRVETSPQVFRDWRMNFASKARAAGISMEMTDRREFANAPAFTKNQVRPINRSGRTEHEGTSSSADRRYRDKRAIRSFNIPETQRSADYQKQVRSAWAEVAAMNSDRSVVSTAREMIHRLDQIQTDPQISDEISHSRPPATAPNLVFFSHQSREGFYVGPTAHPDYNAAENRSEKALVRAETNVEDNNRALMDEQALSVQKRADAPPAKYDLVELTDSFSSGADPESKDSLWDYYFARHGKEVVEKGNEVMLDIEWARDAIERMKSGESEYDTDRLRELKSALNTSLSSAAELAIEGNTFLQDMADLDMDLKAEITLQRDQRVNSSGQRTDTEPPVEKRDTPDPTPEVGSKIPKGENREIDPVNRRVSRLEELQREYEQRQSRDPERDREDR